MKGLWQGTSKFDLSTKILLKTIDSISKTNPRVEFALRVMGHQFPRSANNCKDTKLEVPFAKGNLSRIEQKLKEIRVQGQTPISYALLQSVNDFPPDSTANNAIVLITDGNETCGGSICDISEQLTEKGIVIKPFIVGLGLSDSLKKKFECAGPFYDVQNENAFKATMNVVISRALNATTAQINLLDAYGTPTETNIEMTLSDHHSHAVKYNLIHTLNAKGNPDTLVLDPKIEYDITVHTIPAVSKLSVELVPGIHNTIAIDAPQGTLEIKQELATYNAASVPCIIRKSGSDEILWVQDGNRQQKYLVGNYDIEILTQPEIQMKGIQIEEAKTTTIKIAKPGTLTISPSEAGVASIYEKKDETLSKIFDFYKISTSRSMSLQPGNYVVIFRPDKGKQSGKTRQYPVQIFSAKTSSIKL